MLVRYSVVLLLRSLNSLESSFGMNKKDILVGVRSYFFLKILIALNLN